MRDWSSNIKRVEANQLSSAPPLKPSENIRRQKPSNTLTFIQNNKQNLMMIPFDDPLKFACLQVLQLHVVEFHCLIWLLNSSREFRFSYLLWILFHRRLPLKMVLVYHISKYSCQVDSTNNYHEGCTYFSLNQKIRIIGGLM